MRNRLFSMRMVLCVISLILSMMGICCYTFGSDDRDAEDTGNWEVVEYVDDFGDGTGEKYIKTEINGTVTNSAASDLPLTVIVLFDPIAKEFSFKLLENNETVPAYENSDIIRILFKFDDRIYTHFLDAVTSEGILQLSLQKEWNIVHDTIARIKDDQDTISSPDDIYTALVDAQNALITGKESGYDLLRENLLNNNDARSIIYINSNKYSFVIPAAGFLEAQDIINEEKYNEAKQLFKEKNYVKARELFKIIDGYKDSGEQAVASDTAIKDIDYSIVGQLSRQKKRRF